MKPSNEERVKGKGVDGLIGSISKTARRLLRRAKLAAKSTHSLRVALTLAILLLLYQLALPTWDFVTNYPTAGRQVVQSWVTPQQGLAPSYLVTLPASSGPHALLVALHGAGDRGDSAHRLQRCALANYLREFGPLNAVVVLPQCLERDAWNPDSLSRAIEELCQRYDIDRRKVLVFGTSMGAFGAWSLAAKSPQQIAAIATCAGGGNAEDAYKLSAIPVWAVHGDKDRIVPLAASEQMVESLRRAGGNVRLTVLRGRGHGIAAIREMLPELLGWLLQQRKPTSPSTTIRPPL